MIKLPTKIYIDRSDIHGWGVFASDFIKKDELIEETPYFTLFKRGEEKLECNKELLNDYRFSFPANINWEEQVIPFGCGCIYNHSENSNAYWETDKERKTLKYKAKRDIFPGEEICTYYGPVSYWKKREHINLI
jgi:SET domain-containing protein